MADKPNFWDQLDAINVSRKAVGPAAPPVQAPQQPPVAQPPVAQPQAAQPTTTWATPIGPPVLNPTPDLARLQETQYSFPHLSKQGEPIKVLSKKETWDYAYNKYGPSAFKMNIGPDGRQSFYLDPDLLKKDPYFFKGGSEKMILPFSSGAKEQVFKIVPKSEIMLEPGLQGINPDNLNSVRDQPMVKSLALDMYEAQRRSAREDGNWDDVRDYYLRQAAIVLREDAFRKNYGDDTSIARYMNNTPDNPAVSKVIPNNISNIPGVPTLVGMLSSGYGSVLDSRSASKAVDVGTDMQHLGDPGTFSPGKWDRTFRSKWVPGRNGIRDIIENQYGGELKHMTDEDKESIWNIAAKTYRQQSLEQSVDELKKSNEAKTNSWAGFGTEDARMTQGEAYSKGIGSGVSNSLQNLSASFMATGAPIAASAVASWLGGPAAGRAASSGVTYKLSHDSEFMDQVTTWLDSHDIDITNMTADEVSRRIMDLAVKDPDKFNRELNGMRQMAHLAGGLEAGVAFGLDVGLDKGLHRIGFGKFSKEGSVIRAAMKVGNRKVFTKLLAPRALRVFEDATKEGIEEYLTEVIVGFGKDAAKNYQNGQEIYDAAREAVRNLARSYTEEDDQSNETAEQRNQAGVIGIYMSLMMKAATGRGNPDTAGLRTVRSNAAREIEDLRRKFPMGGPRRSVDQIVGELQKLEQNSFEQFADFAEELFLMHGHGDLQDVMNSETGINPSTGTPYNQSDIPARDIPADKQIEMTPVSFNEAVQFPGVTPITILPAGQPVPPPVVRNGKLVRYFRKMENGDIVDVTFENAPK
jgi:hypothetical protein